MAIFGDGLSPKEVCKLQILEVETRLSKYDANNEDIEAISEMISEAYTKLEAREEIHNDFKKVLSEEFGQEFLDRIESKALMKRTGKLMNLLMEDEDDTLPFEGDDGWDDYE